MNALGVDMKQGFPNLERIVRTKGIKVRKCSASCRISTNKLRTYKVSSLLLKMIVHAVKQLGKRGV